jgi:hypothetical protein
MPGPMHEKRWQPDAEMLASLPERYTLLLSPAGFSHLMLDDDGQWWHLQANGQHRTVSAGQAAQLRPGDVALVIKAAMVWSWRHGTDNPRSPTMVDELAAGVQIMVKTYAAAAGARPAPANGRR